MLKNAVHEILTHESVSREAGISKEVQSSYNTLIASGEQAVPFIVSALNECARGQISRHRWWYGAKELCKLLAHNKSTSAKEALLAILKSDSNIVEFDEIRSSVVDLIQSFNDPSVIPALLEASKVPHAPILAINKAIEALGGTKPVTPESIILEGKEIADDTAAIQYFANHAVQVSGWSSKELQGAFYWWYGNRVEKSKGLQSALPYYAAAVLADNDSEAPAWSKFRGISPSAQSARKLSEQHPLSSASADKVSPSAKQKDKSSESSGAAVQSPSDSWHFKNALYGLGILILCLMVLGGSMTVLMRPSSGVIDQNLAQKLSTVIGLLFFVLIYFILFFVSKRAEKKARRSHP
jgi:hypothetical protein